MDTSDTRVTREQAAELVKVSVRTVSRWSAAGLITPEYDPQFRRPATYAVEEVLAAPERWAALLQETLADSDIST